MDIPAVARGQNAAAKRCLGTARGPRADHLGDTNEMVRLRVVLEPEEAELGSRLAESSIPYRVKRTLAK